MKKSEQSLIPQYLPEEQLATLPINPFSKFSFTISLEPESSTSTVTPFPKIILIKWKKILSYTQYYSSYKAKLNQAQCFR